MTATIRFVCSTYDTQGQFRPFPPEALHFWQTYGEQVGRVLRPELGLTLAEIVAGCRELRWEELRAGGAGGDVDEMFVAWCLLKLVEYGMAEVEMD